MTSRSTFVLATVAASAFVFTACTKTHAPQTESGTDSAARVPPAVSAGSDPFNPTDRARYSDSAGTAISMMVLPPGPFKFWISKPGLDTISGTHQKASGTDANGNDISMRTKLFSVDSNGLKCKLLVTMEHRGNSISAKVQDETKDADCKLYEVVFTPPSAGETKLPASDLTLCQGNCKK